MSDHGVSTALVHLTDADRLRLLEPPAPSTGPVDMVLDTDTYNEIDDQFALAYAMLSPERLRVEAVYAAPFENARSDGPASGMQASHAEIVRVLERLGKDPKGFAFEGARAWLSDTVGPDSAVGPGPNARHGPVDPTDGQNIPADPTEVRNTPVDPHDVQNPAAADLIERARSRPSGRPLYVVAIGAPTNVATALLLAPDIANRIVVVWLGGNPVGWQPGAEFNVYQDMRASRVLLDSGVALVHVPCVNVTEHLRTTLAEIDRFVRPCGAIGAYLAEIFENYRDDHFGRSKVLWDVGAIAWLVDPTWTPSVLVHSPRLQDDHSWSLDPARHLIREVRSVNRDAVFRDLFRKLADHA